MTDSFDPSSSGTVCRKARLAYLVSHPIQYQAPLLRRIALEPDIDLTVLFGSDFSVRGYKDRGFGVEVAWDTPLLEGYRSEFLRPFRDTGEVSPTTPISRGIFRRLQQSDGSPAFDALWVHGYASINSLQAILAANALGIPVLLRAESWLADRVRTPWKLVLKKKFFRMLGKGIAAVLPIGTVNAEYWTHYFGTSVPKFMMPYAVNNEYFAGLAAAAVPREQELRAELGLSAERPVILFASKLQQRKHADHLIEAYSRFIADRTPDTRPYLVVVGDGEQRTQLEAQAQQLRLEDVRFAGFRNQSELPRFFQLADVFVLPSRHEPWGLIVNEAMASGCPVIVSTDVGCHADLITDGVEGCVFPVGDIGALTQALHRVFSSPQTAAKMGEAARRRISTWTYEEDVHGLRRALAAVTRMTKDW
ncbi:glycosyltransferase family 4 protein [Granulicella sp. L46]|uniref:glycosyltransferase family 4 protein n=1 Tax=Granulicella sp. L46 TaxID=1641865 RepID=UPI00131CED32|nr:glycosyltransferase family 4 protein [Granulicella sp. L46]